MDIKLSMYLFLKSQILCLACVDNDIFTVTHSFQMFILFYDPPSDILRVFHHWLEKKLCDVRIKCMMGVGIETENNMLCMML